MKKFALLVIASILAFAPMANAADKYISAADLPTTVISFIEKNFGKNKINHVWMDRGVFGAKDYDVILSDGTELEFDANGALKEVASGKGIPSAVVPKVITDYVARYYPKSKIVKMEVDRKGYELTLKSGLELKFDPAGRFLKADH